ncbi:uncharacterized protein si:ch211-67e16.4 [Melanotaenia boesemani]|uniref:uncharacterized protein si:ch211-67e16.4 n=1 Tax=Melanotaenia boesemani TaxID=1250792 RepID=UPI001C053AE5|nr:uncharacterized protein si:ch211-67e16.4 [Melanotaenia boesemani]
MDVSIAVSLIRGQMGTVVERAVNVAVETVLAEMLKVVGVKFEELKVQVVLMKKEMAALQREKALKEKENDNIRAKLRYTELKLKYYRQGVEEELQQRTSTSALVRIHPPTFSRVQTPSCSAHRSAEGALMRTNQVPECTSSQSESRPAVRARCSPDVAGSDSSDLLLPVTLNMNASAECLDSSSVLFCPSEPDPAQRRGVEREDECEWTVTVLPHEDDLDAAAAPPPGPAQTVAAGQQSTPASLSPDVSALADSSMLPSSAAQVKQEVQPQQEQEEEMICIKEEPEEEQEVMTTLLLDYQVQQDHPPKSETQRSGMGWSRPPASQMNPGAAVSSAGPGTYGPAQFSASLAATSVAPLSVPPRQVVRPWPKDLSLYEEYKLRRNELRRRNLNRRRELEKTLPQPLLADLVRERREKTRLRVARWRAKRKLQACLNQAQAHGGAAGLSQTGFPPSSQQQQIAAPCASSNQQRHPAAPRTSSFLSNMSVNTVSAALPLNPSSSSSSLLLRGPSMAPHEHTVTSSSSSYRPVGPSQHSISLTDSDLLQ